MTFGANAYFAPERVFWSTSRITRLAISTGSTPLRDAFAKVDSNRFSIRSSKSRSPTSSNLASRYNSALKLSPRHEDLPLFFRNEWAGYKDHAIDIGSCQDIQRKKQRPDEALFGRSHSESKDALSPMAERCHSFTTKCIDAPPERLVLLCHLGEWRNW